MGVVIRVITRAVVSNERDRVGPAHTLQMFAGHALAKLVEAVEGRQAALPTLIAVVIETVRVLHGDKHGHGPVVPLDEDPLPGRGGIEQLAQLAPEFECRHGSHVRP